MTVSKVVAGLHDDGYRASLTQSLQENVNDNSFSGHMKFTVWNFITSM